MQVSKIPVCWVFFIINKDEYDIISEGFNKYSIGSLYPSLISKIFSGHAFLLLVVHSLEVWPCRMSPPCALHPRTKEVSCKRGAHRSTPKSHQPWAPLTAEPHLRGRAFLPVIQGETNHQMSDLLTLLATLNVLSCKVLRGFIFLSFPSLQLLVIIIIKHKWPLSHSARRVLLWIKPNYRERVCMMILRVIQRASSN